MELKLIITNTTTVKKDMSVDTPFVIVASHMNTKIKTPYS